ncbi:hypothetical protein, variant [Capsaspora owczarzaki ATCC 30864]|uniref:hypothetical protein, variant n=1 Tax=Capsaspora owczarzaki (strain ATCC 30864) TaxID=595528 RepID=UPI00035241A1|nr:hypothetical protein, variant [Capsaspora owczarzaki ATCC 30864]|eukprot:XP_011270678.1 hypothetical protein, variant [Capsaspora owczarzaki ATCC 30864]
MITFHGLRGLCKKVKTAPGKVLLSRSQIGDAEAQAVAKALKFTATTTYVDLSENHISCAGALAIVEALKMNTRLKFLDLSDNRIGDAGAQAIAEALTVNKTLSGIHLSNDQISNAGATALAEALKVNETLTNLHLVKNHIGDAGAQALAEALKVNKTLTELWLNFNQIGDVGAQAIAEALRVNKTLTQLVLFSNCIGKLGSQAIDAACAGNRRCLVGLNTQISPFAFSLFPRLASGEDSQAVFRMLTGGLENQPASLPALPTEIAELIMDEARYWQGAQHTKRNRFHVDTSDGVLTVTVPRSMDGNSIRVKAIQVLRDWTSSFYNSDDCAFGLTVRDEQGDVQYECAVHPTLVESNLARATIWPTSHPILRQMREGWQVQIRFTRDNLQIQWLCVEYVDLDLQ